MTSFVTVCLIAAALRWGTTLFSYSGQAKPPLHGDYEAQRHWMEITTNLPIEKWYMNSSDNDLQYWGLDYPPLTAYHSYLCGIVAKWFNPDFVALEASRGFESYEHKLFMRWTVIVADFCVFVPALIYYFKCRSRKSYYGMKYIHHAEKFALIGLSYPGFILIDHGHFQYNCISLGLALLAITFIGEGKYTLATISFCLALSYKQMELYHALPFFFYFCGQSYFQSSIINTLSSFYLRAVTVIMTFAVVWHPFLTSKDQFLQVLHRMFPFARGVFEDKVANVWCSVNIIIKVKQMFDTATMAKLCLSTTLSLILMPGFHLFWKPRVKTFTYALINISLIFFLFSFQVHEKSILLASLPAVLLFPDEPAACFWFLLVTLFSMIPLIIKDNLLIPFIALMIIFIVIVATTYFDMYYKFNTNLSKENILKQLSFEMSVICVIFIASMFGFVVLTYANVFMIPPKKYPDLFPVLISSFSCLHFLGFMFYFHGRQLNFF